MGSETTIGDYVSLQRGTTYEGPLVGKAGPALLGLGSIVPGGGFRDDHKTYGGECPPNLMLKPGDLFVSLKGATKDGEMIGSVARVPLTVPSGRLTQDTVGLAFKNPDREIVSFVYWVLRTPQYRDYCRGRATGSAVVAMSRSDFLSYPVPNLTEGRRRLVRLFDAIEEKIELNRRRNRTLESMARAIFQSWFVDFDPVHAKAAGRKPAGLSKDIAALFPASFEDSTLGPIPKGWRACCWGDIVTLEYGKSLREYATGPHRVFGTNGPIGWHTESLCDGPGIVIGRKGAYRGVHYSPRAFFVIDTAFYLKPKTWVEMKWAYYELLRCDINGMDSGSAIPSTSRPDFYAIPVCLPSPSVLEAFGRLTQPIYDQRDAHESENATLAALRDTLLPKLISGELRVPDAERIVGRAT